MDEAYLDVVYEDRPQGRPSIRVIEVDIMPAHERGISDEGPDRVLEF